MPEPVLSVVLTVVDGGDALRRCLASLGAQRDAPPMEVLVPWDATIPSVVAIAGENGSTGDAASIRLLDLGHLPQTSSGRAASRQHELIDRRRAAGLAAARGEIVAIIEDRSLPRPGWAGTIVRLHRELPHAVIGGAVEIGRRAVLSQAVYFCDFGRYQPPFEAGPRPYVTDVNVSYKRRALDRTREIWRDRYHEPLVHWALERAGETVFLSPEPIVVQVRDGLTLGGLLAERMAWGRLFGSLRARDASFATRIGLLVRSPFVPPVLFARFIRDRLVRGGASRSILVTGPAVALLQTAWVAGEAAGYLGRPTGSPTDKKSP
jgi:hypothetical protein